MFLPSFNFRNNRAYVKLKKNSTFEILKLAYKTEKLIIKLDITRNIHPCEEISQLLTFLVLSS